MLGKKFGPVPKTPLGTIGHRVEVRSVEADQEHAPDVNGTVADEPGDDVVRVDSGKDKGQAGEKEATVAGADDEPPPGPAKSPLESRCEMVVESEERSGGSKRFYRHVRYAPVSSRLASRCRRQYDPDRERRRLVEISKKYRALVGTDSEDGGSMKDSEGDNHSIVAGSQVNVQGGGGGGGQMGNNVNANQV
ncbi:hypothetical protein pipiens_015508 [Culex pipiens pipiens]|uniref:Uncharacterized protein n=1 Tax=Culex pipiens pipiens TaxID=38569 RepID=A0ABD1CQ78_CULPP